MPHPRYSKATKALLPLDFTRALALRPRRAVAVLLTLVPVVSLGACYGGDTGGTSSTDPHGLGTICNLGSDCSENFFCNTDPAVSAPQGQCTLPCGDSALCTEFAGPRSRCTSANVCVRSCLSDEDCPTETACSAAGYCNRSVPRAPAGARCTGTPKGCGDVTATGENCEDAPGCVEVARCVGTPTPCNKQPVDGCGFSGCFFNIDTALCDGTPNACESAPGPGSCDDISGCTYTHPCVGTPEPCESLRPSQCVLQPGCAQQ